MGKEYRAKTVRKKIFTLASSAAVLRALALIPVLLALISCEPRVTHYNLQLYVSEATLKRTGTDGDEIWFMLTTDEACQHEFSKQFAVGGFPGRNVGQQLKLIEKTIAVYLQNDNERRTMMTNIHMCIRSQGKWARAWSGRFSLDIAGQNFYCTKKDNRSNWECIACIHCDAEGLNRDRFVTKYDRLAR